MHSRKRIAVAISKSGSRSMSSCACCLFETVSVHLTHIKSPWCFANPLPPGRRASGARHGVELLRGDRYAIYRA